MLTDVGGIPDGVHAAVGMAGGDRFDQLPRERELAGVAGRHSWASTGRHTGRVSNGNSTTIPATTQQVPNPIGLGPFAAPSCCHATPNTFLPERLNNLSSTTTVLADPTGSNRSTIRSTIRSTSTSPTASAHQRAVAKNRCARA